MAETLLALRDVAVHHGEHVALQVAVSQKFTRVTYWPLIGPNGAGKSTLLRVMGMLQRPDKGLFCFAVKTHLTATPSSLGGASLPCFRSLCC